MLPACLFLLTSALCLLTTPAAGQFARPAGIPADWRDKITKNDSDGIIRDFHDPKAPTTSCRYQLSYISPDLEEKERAQALGTLDAVLERYPRSHLDEGLEMDLVEYATVKEQPAALSEISVGPTRAEPRFIPERTRNLMWVISLTPRAGQPSRLGIVSFSCRSRLATWAKTQEIFDASIPPYQTVAPPNARASSAPLPPSVGGGMLGRWPVTSLRVLEPGDLSGLSPLALRLMRNEILARHGHMFLPGDLRDYFTQQPWYSPQGGDASARLSAIERRNIELIEIAERGALR